ncbi:MAG TPA: hemerythrin domain-containing protein [Burkholderiaceae bacterium]|jgi:hemerythrin superfamily protein|nr:hemerythrin domain-containing protein [Burkholderiaceae bacterium]
MTTAVELTPEAEPTEAVDLLTQQHRRLEALLAALVEEAPLEVRSAHLKRAGDELAVHLSAEEQVFYPAVRAERTEDILLESLEEHLSLKRLLADLLDLDPGDTTFTPKCKVLREQVEHHHGEEEENLFPKVRKLLPDRRRVQLAQEMLEHQASLPLSGKPREMAAAQTDAAETLDPTPPEVR